MASATTTVDPRYVEPTYVLSPRAENLFAVSACSKIAEEVVKAVIGDKKWTGDGEEAVWAVQITEQCVFASQFH